MASLRILLADDHELVCSGVRKILEEQPGWRVVAQATDGRDAVRLGAEHQPDIAVLDISMPCMNGVEAAIQLGERSPATRVLLMSMHSEPAFVSRALHAGVKGYLLKTATDTDLVHAVTALATGHTFFSPSIVDHLVNDFVHRSKQTDSAGQLDCLTAREREILQLVAECRTNRAIADLLGLQLSTVETHRAQIMKKLRLHSTAELIRYAAQVGIVK
jgi:DNA-binding NarL/FixJ family response regulator